MYPTPPGETRAPADVATRPDRETYGRGQAWAGTRADAMPLLRRKVRQQRCDPLGRRDRQPAAFAPEMGLVGVAGFDRETSRRAIAGAAQEFEEALKSQDAVECLGSVSECRVEAPAQGGFAQAESPGQPWDERLARRRAGREQRERRLHVRWAGRDRWRSPRQRKLEHSQAP